MDPHIFGSWMIRIRITVKSYIRIRIKVKIQKRWRLKIEPWRTVDALNGGLKAQTGALDQWSQVPIHSCIRIQIRIEVKSWIWIRIDVKTRIRIDVKTRIRNPVVTNSTLKLIYLQAGGF
jgi:hypothetical protein